MMLSMIAQKNPSIATDHELWAWTPGTARWADATRSGKWTAGGVGAPRTLLSKRWTVRP